MNKINDGGPAFGALSVSPAGDVYHQEGMSLRDWFAGHALAGIMANETTPFSADHAEVEPSQIAAAVYELADAMLAKREKDRQP
jgi:hypothetical protein